MENKKGKNKFIRFLLKNILHFSILAINIIIMIILINHTANNTKINNEGVVELSTIINEKIDYQNEFLVEATGALVSSASAIILYEIENANTDTMTRINRINNVYASLLAEMEKRTLDSIYSEVVLKDMEKEAQAHFSQGRFAQANALYSTIASSQPENKEAQFYYLYSMFLNNRMYRGNYRQIKEGLLALERGGFYRREVREIINFIESEEGITVSESAR